MVRSRNIKPSAAGAVVISHTRGCGGLNEAFGLMNARTLPICENAIALYSPQTAR
ncbi:MAG TPA: hypothetical protein V6D48_09770 [Oculatellaceae cyanobacterium]